MVRFFIQFSLPHVIRVNVEIVLSPSLREENGDFALEKIRLRHHSGKVSISKSAAPAVLGPLGTAPAEITGKSGGSPLQARCTCLTGEPG